MWFVSPKPKILLRLISGGWSLHPLLSKPMLLLWNIVPFYELRRSQYAGESARHTFLLFLTIKGDTWGVLTGVS